MIEILCDDSTCCKETGDNNDYHRRKQRQTLIMSAKSLSIYCFVSYNGKTIFSICGSMFSIICTVLGNVSKSPWT